MDEVFSGSMASVVRLWKRGFRHTIVEVRVVVAIEKVSQVVLQRKPVVLHVQI